MCTPLKEVPTEEDEEEDEDVTVVVDATVVSELKDDVAEMAAAEASLTSTSGALSDLLEAPRRSRLMTELSLVLQMEPAHVMLLPMLILLFFLLLLLLLLPCCVSAAGAGGGWVLSLPEVRVEDG
jgi:hypothetical protein